MQYVDEYGVQLTEEEIKNMDTQTLEAALPNIEVASQGFCIEGGGVSVIREAAYFF